MTTDNTVLMTVKIIHIFSANMQKLNAQRLHDCRAGCPACTELSHVLELPLLCPTYGEEGSEGAAPQQL